MPTISAAGMALLTTAFGQTQAQSLQPAFQQSATLVSLIETFASENTSPRILLGAPGKGTSISGSVITIDPNWLPNSGQLGQTDPASFATVLAHELGHATQLNGEANFAGVTSFATAVRLGDNAEGVALLAEYQVALEEGVTMHSGAVVQAQIAQAVQPYTPGTAQYQSAAIAAGANWTATQWASDSIGSVSPTTDNPNGYATYNQYYMIQYEVQQAGGNPGTIDWQHDVTITNNPDGSWSYNVKNISAPTGPVGIFGVYRTSLAGQAMLDDSLTNPATSGTVSETVQTAASDGSPQDTVQVTYGAGTDPTTNVTVTNSSGSTQNYTMSGTPGVEDAIDAAATASSSASTILIGGDNATLQGGSGNNLFIDLGNSGTVIGGSGTNTIQLDGNADSATSTTGATTLTALGNNDTATVGDNASISMSGIADAVTAGSNSSDWLRGSDDVLNSLGTGTTAWAVGTADTVNAGGNSVIDLVGSAAVANLGTNSVTWEYGIGDQATLQANGIIDQYGSNEVGVGGTGTSGWMAGTDGSLSVGNSSTVTAVSNDNSLTLGTGSTATVNGTDETLNGTNAIINAGSGFSGNAFGSDLTVNLTGSTGAYMGLFGQSNTVNGDSGTNVVNLGGTDTSAIVNGNGTVGLCGVGQYLTLGSAGATVATINDATGETILDNGGGAIVDTGSGFSGNVQGTSVTVNLGGTGDSLGLLAGSGYLVNGTDASITTSGSVSFNVAGGNDGIVLGGSGDYLGLLGGSGYSVDAVGDQIDTWNNTSFNLVGGSDALGLGTGDTLGLLGGSGYSVSGSDDAINTLSDTSFNLAGGDDSVALGGTGDYLGLLGGSGYTVYGTADQINTWDDTSFNLSGGDDTLGLGTGDYLGLLGGSGYSVTESGGTIATLGDTDLTLAGGNDSVTMGGTGDGLTITEGAGYSINETDGSLDMTANGLAASLSGSGDTVDATFDTLTVDGNADQIYGSGDTVHATGSGDSTIGSGNYDSGSGFGSSGGGGLLGNLGDVSISGGLGFVTVLFHFFFGFVNGDPGVTDPGTDVVSQYEIAQGNTQAAAQAEVAYTQAYQSEAGDLARSSATLSEDSVGATWAGDTVTFNFATGPTTGVAPVSSAMDSQADAIIEQAMQSWAGVSGITFQQVADSTTADVSFGWGDFETASSNMIGSTYVQQANGLGQSGSVIRLEDPNETALYTDANGQLAYTGTGGATLYQVALHEIGHALGLSDTSDPNSVMYYSLGANNPGLDATDIAAVQSVYGTPGHPH